jgi:uncharacterized protein with PIN domain
MQVDFIFHVPGTMPPVGFKSPTVLLLMDSALLPYKHALTGSGDFGFVLSIEVALLAAVAQVFTGTRAEIAAVFTAAAHGADLAAVPASDDQAIRFLVPNTLWRLVRWLRCAGIDCASTEPGISAQAQVTRARVEGRTVITLSQKLALMCGPDVPCHVLRSNNLRAQFADVLVHFGIQLSAAAFMQRCTKCNGLFRGLTPEQAAFHPQFATNPRIPAAKQFWECIGCQKVVWRGSQYKRIKDTFQSLYGDEQLPSEEVGIFDDVAVVDFELVEPEGEDFV